MDTTESAGAGSSRRDHTSSTAGPRLADCVIRAGAIYAMTPDRAVYRAIALRDEWIVATAADPPRSGRFCRVVLG